VVVTPQYQRAADFSEGLAAVEVGGKWGYIDKTGRMVIQPQFGSALRFYGGVARVSVGDKHGLIDATGKFIWGPTKIEHRAAWWWELPIAILTKNG
jgi:hypothetical protein